MNVHAEMMVEDNILDERVSMGEIMEALNGLKDGKSPVKGGIPRSFISKPRGSLWN